MTLMRTNEVSVVAANGCYGRARRNRRCVKQLGLNWRKLMHIKMGGRLVHHARQLVFQMILW